MTSRNLTLPVTFTKVYSVDGVPLNTGRIVLLDGITAVGSDKPSWRLLAKAGSDCTNEYNLSAVRRKTSGAIVRGRYKTPDDKWHDMEAVNPLFYPSIDNMGDYSQLVERTTNRATNLFFKNVRGTQREISGPTFVAEFRDTVRMLKRPASALRDFTISWSERARSRSRQLKGYPLRKMLAQSYLEYTFGVKPFLADTEAIARAIAKAQYAKRINRVTAYAKDDDTGPMVLSGFSPGGYLKIATESFTSATAFTGVNAAVVGETTAPSDGSADTVRRLIDTCGFNWSEVVPAAWEALPWSFVIDYFTNVGDVLSARTTSLANLRFYSISSKLTRRYTSIGHVVPEINDYVVVPAQAAGSVGSTVVSFQRGKGVVYPTFALEIPGIRQGINLAALWAARNR